MEIDLHGYHPQTIRDGDLLPKILQQAWEMGEKELIIIHGHGKGKGIPPQFANTNTGYLGLVIRGLLRHDKRLRQWMYSRIYVSHPGATRVRLRSNSNPTRSNFDNNALPERDFDR